MSRRNRLAIVGSQAKSWQPTGITLCRIFIAAAMTFRDATELVSGGCDGVDQYAEDEADARALQKTIFEPSQKDWEHYRARNIQIAEYCDELVAIRSSASKTYGSGWTADYTQNLGKPVWRINL